MEIFSALTIFSNYQWGTNEVLIIGAHWKIQSTVELLSRKQTDEQNSLVPVYFKGRVRVDQQLLNQLSFNPLFW